MSTALKALNMRKKSPSEISDHWRFKSAVFDQCCRCRCSLIVLCCDTLFKCLSVDECFWPIVTDCTCPGWAETVTQVRNINSVITWIKLSLIQHSTFCLLTMVFLQDSKSLVSADQTRSYYFCRLSVTKVGLDFVTILNRILKLNF